MMNLTAATSFLPPSARQGRRPMQTHPADCLRGPQSRAWWPRSEPETADPAELPRRDDPQIRWELVDRIRREIAAGTYETPDKLETALENLLERLEE
jgi:hypothetical protein